jgi:putative NADPH-quinone reductase
LASAYAEGAKAAGCDVDLMFLGDMDFEATPRGRPGPLEDDLAEARERIRQANHLVLVYPTWMGAMPARMKGFFERAFGEGFAVRMDKDSRLPVPLLTGRSAEVLVTMDTPPLLYRLALGAPGHRMVRWGILAPAGIRRVRVRSFGPLRASTEGRRMRWLEKVRKSGYSAGRSLAHRVTRTR